MNNWITAEMLGDIATDEQAEQMADLLIYHGITEGCDVEDIPDAVWGACLDVISKQYAYNF